MPLLGKEQMAGAFPAGGSILCERGGIAYAPARDAGERKLMRVRLPPFAPIYRGVVGIRIHGGLKIRWASNAHAGAIDSYSASEYSGLWPAPSVRRSARCAPPAAATKRLCVEQ